MEQPHVLDDVGGAALGRRDLCLRQQPLDVALRLGHVQAASGDHRQCRQLFRLAAETQQSAGVALGQVGLPQTVPHRLSRSSRSLLATADWDLPSFSAACS